MKDNEIQFSTTGSFSASNTTSSLSDVSIVNAHDICIDPFSIPLNSISGGSIIVPLSFSFEPLEDITAYELAQLLPYLHGKRLFKEDIEEKPELFRHLEIH